MVDATNILKKCAILLDAYKEGKLGNTRMPEEAHPAFSPKDAEFRLAYFTLPMSLNYQRDSYKLWEAALRTAQDEETAGVFDAARASTMSTEQLRNHLTKYKLALQPNKHIATWQAIAKTVAQHWGSFQGLINAAHADYAQLRQLMQQTHKKAFPYISGPKLFNYWCFILQAYGGVKLHNATLIEIAPDTHVTQCSVRLGVITPQEADTLSKEDIAARWRELLKDSRMTPIEMHPPLWFWSRNNFQFQLPE